MLGFPTSPGPSCGPFVLTAALSFPPAGMKRPLSPSHSPENGLRLVEPASGQPEQRLKREKKQQSFTLCEVCNIQLNSAAQAQIHYNGKSHQKRLKQLNKGKMPAAQGRSSDRRCPKAALALGQLLPWVWRGRPVGCSRGMFGNVVLWPLTVTCWCP